MGSEWDDDVMMMQSGHITNRKKKAQWSAAKSPCKINAGFHTSSFGNAMLEVLLHHAFHRHEVPVAKPWILRTVWHCHWWLMHILMRCLLQSGVSFSSSVSPTWRQGVLTCTAQAFKSPKFHSMSWVLVPTPQARSVAVQTYAPVPRTEKQYLGSPALWNISYDIMMSPLPTTFDLKMKSQIQEIPWTSPKCWIPWLSLPWHWYPLTSLEKELHRLHANQAKLHHPGTEVPVLSTCSQHKSRDLVLVLL